MGNKLFPVFDTPSVLAEDLRTPKMYRPAPLWDFESGDFVFDGERRPIYGSGYDAWVFWCIKSLMTQRGAHYAYSMNMGIEAAEAFAEPNKKAQESAFRRTITEALLADPLARTEQVRDFEFQWSPEGSAVTVTCTVIGYDGNSATIKAAIRM